MLDTISKDYMLENTFILNMLCFPSISPTTVWRSIASLYITRLRVAQNNKNEAHINVSAIGFTARFSYFRFLYNSQLRILQFDIKVTNENRQNSTISILVSFILLICQKLRRMKMKLMKLIVTPIPKTVNVRTQDCVFDGSKHILNKNNFFE